MRFHACDMQLNVDSDAAYLVQPQARSRYAGYFYLGSPQPKHYILNGAVLVTCRTIRSVCASAAEAETAGLFHNAQHAIVIKRILEVMGHKQNPVPLKTDNSTANSFVYDNIKQRKSKTWDMRFNWLRDRSFKRDIRIFCDKVENNHADYLFLSLIHI